jgi:hypothetical protein
MLNLASCIYAVLKNSKSSQLAKFIHLSCVIIIIINRGRDTGDTVLFHEGTKIAF